MPQAKSFILITILLSFCSIIFAQDLNENHKEIRKSVVNKEFEKAIDKLKSLQKSNPKIFTANNYDYLLARLSEKQGDVATATANYQSVVNRNSILKEYALWHLSQIMRSSGNLILERFYLQEISIISDKSLLQNAVKKRFTRSHLESGNYEFAIKLLNNQNSHSSKTSDDTETILETVTENLPGFGKDIPREDLVLLAEAYSQNKQIDKAKEVYTELVENFPRENRPDDYALAGVKGLDRLEVGEDNFGKAVNEKLSVENQFERATIYQFNRNFSLARLHYEAIVKNHATDKKATTAIYQIARGFGQERNYEKVVEWSEKLQKEYPEDSLASAALYQTAGAYANLNNTNEAVKRYLKYIDENPDVKNIERAFLNIVDAYRDENNPKTALNWTAKIQERFKGELGESVALFAQIKIHISQENWQNALNDLNRLKDMKNLGGISIAGGTNRDEVTFLRGFVLEKLGRYDQAFDVYLSLGEGFNNYHIGRADERLRELKKDGKTTKLIIKKSSSDEVLPPVKPVRILEYGREKVWQTQQKIRTHKNISDELLFLGLYDEGTPELETAMRDNLSKSTGSLSDFSGDIAMTLAEYYRRGDMAHKSISYIEPTYKKSLKNTPLKAIPRRVLKLLYPKPFEDPLVKYSEEYDVDPRFVLSIMRQESRFQADVKSIAAARGLMQFISNTSDQMAEEMKLDNFKQNDLYNPPTAIRFGSHYINKIFKDFPNQPPAVAASYNAGEDRMMRWIKRANTDDPDRYVPEVVFTQTKDYVYKVMANYRIYKMLYNIKLKEINK